MVPKTYAEVMEYYVREMAYLRQSGAEFASTYPQVAARLGVSGEEASDPHVERLLESFAYLSANLHKSIDDQFPRIASTILSVLYPQFEAPIPSMGIVSFDAASDSGKLTKGLTIPKHALLNAPLDGGNICRLRTGWETELWPLEVTGTRMVKTQELDFGTRISKEPEVLAIDLASIQVELHTLPIQKLRFYIALPALSAQALYTALFMGSVQIALQGDDGAPPVFLSPKSLRPLGLEPDELLIPNPTHVHPVYNLLLEYFTFQRKFMFFEIDNWPAMTAKKKMTLFLGIQNGRALGSLESPCVRLGCTPVINLFPKISDPIRLDHTQVEYPLFGDVRRDDSTEIYRIESVSSTSDVAPAVQQVMPYFSFNHRAFQGKQNVFWAARRTPHLQLPGTQIWLSLVDFNFNPETPDVPTLYAQLLCTNRSAASQLPAGATLSGEAEAAGLKITLQGQVTPQMPPQLADSGAWRFISQLALNHLSLANDGLSTEALKEVLRLYATMNTQRTFSEIDGIVSVNCVQAVRRAPVTPWPSMALGIATQILMDETFLSGGEMLLFTTVLQRFLTLYVAMNSFVEVQLMTRQKEGILKTWSPILGNNAPL